MGSTDENLIYFRSDVTLFVSIRHLPTLTVLHLLKGLPQLIMTVIISSTVSIYLSIYDFHQIFLFYIFSFNKNI